MGQRHQFIVSSQFTRHLSDTTSQFSQNRCDSPAGACASTDESGNVSNANVPKRKVWEACCSVQPHRGGPYGGCAI